MKHLFAGRCAKCKTETVATLELDKAVSPPQVLGLTCGCGPLSHVVVTRRGDRG